MYDLYPKGYRRFMKNTKKNGFTLVELLIVITIVVMMAVAIVGTLNPAALTDKAYDARRKKDLNRIRIAFEDYFTDKECYPSQAEIDALVCDKSGFAPWMPSWPCDPTGAKYTFMMDDSGCPHWYRVLANLQNRNDKDIPSGWFTLPTSYHYGNGNLTVNDFNYGVSSPNITWSDEVIAKICVDPFGSCYIKTGPNTCGALPRGVQHLNSYVNTDCLSGCLVSCCMDGSICK
jgi:prepilin-type N-terminal cleavage/methylation domain-containing protein